MTMKVRIHRPLKSLMQSNPLEKDIWMIEPELPTARRNEPLMGWVSSGDTMNQVKLKFKTLDEAINYAKTKNWEYSITPENPVRKKPRNYGQNFVYRPPVEADMEEGA